MTDEKKHPPWGVIANRVRRFCRSRWPRCDASLEAKQTQGIGLANIGKQRKNPAAHKATSGLQVNTRRSVALKFVDKLLYLFDKTPLPVLVIVGWLCGMFFKS